MRTAAGFSGRPAPLASVPAGLLSAAAGAARFVETVVPLPAALSSETLAILAGTTYLGASDKARRELGFAARPLHEGLRHLVEHEMRLLGLTPPGPA